MPLTPASLLHALSPRSAVFATDEVTASCQANGCKGLDELFRPWEGGVERVSILSSQLTPTVHPTFALRFTSHEALVAAQTGGRGAVPYSPEVVVDVISNLVGKLRPEEDKHYDVFRDVLLASRPISEHETFNHPVCLILATSTSTPDPLSALSNLQNRSLASPAYSSRPYMDSSIGAVLRFWLVIHDVAREGPSLDRAHQLLAQVKKAYGPHATLLVINSALTVSAGHADGVVDEAAPAAPPFSAAYEAALSNLALNDPFMNLTSLLSDTTGVRTSSEPTSAPSSLVISQAAIANGSTAPSPVYAAQLGPQDIAAIRAFLRELTTQSLVPWMEGRIREWHEIFNSSRRGITGRLFGAGRKFFGSAPAAKGPGQSGYNSIRGYYPPNAPEAISRRLADFTFMLRDYKAATGIYDSIRRDYIQDGAVKLGASATEMYGLSTLMGLSPAADPKSSSKSQQQSATLIEAESWLEQAVVAYTSHPNPGLDVLRVTLLYYEAWKAFGAIEQAWDWHGVSRSLVRGAGEAEEVPSAIFLEQAAHVDVISPKKRHRKHAFHLVMAARRYETSGHRSYSRKCLQCALNDYRDQQPPWLFAQNYIEFSLGRQAYTLGESDIAAEHFVRLLRRGMGSEGQGDVLEDFALAFEQLRSHPELYAAALPRIALPTPIIDIVRSCIRVPSDDSDFGVDAQQWTDLEDRFLGSSFSGAAKHSTRLLRPADRTLAATGEPFFLCLVASNPMNAAIKISRLTVEVDSLDTDGQATGIEVESVDDFDLAPLETRELNVRITSATAGSYRMSSVTFLFHDMLPCKQSLKKKGKRLFGTKQERLEAAYAQDTSLDISIGSAAPNIQVDLDALPSILLHGELRSVPVTFTNTGTLRINRLEVLSSVPGFLMLGDSSNLSLAAEQPTVIDLPEGGLPADQQVTVTSTVYGHLVGDSEVLLFFAFQADNATYGSTRMVHLFQVLPSITLAASFAPSLTQANIYDAELSIEHVGESLDISIDAVDLTGKDWEVVGGDLAQIDSSLDQLVDGQTGTCLTSVRLAAAGPDAAESHIAEQLARVLRGLPVVAAPATGNIPPPVRLCTASESSGGSRDLSPPLAALRQFAATTALAQLYPTIPAVDLAKIFPLYPSLELDLAIRWSVNSDGPDSTIRGYNILHGLRPSPQQSLLDRVRAQINASGDKNIRSMYEETNRQKRLLLESVMEGPLAIEECPVRVRLAVPSARRGRVRHDFAKGPCSVQVQADIFNLSPRFSAKYTLRLNNATPQSTLDDANLPRHIRFTGALTRRGRLDKLDTTRLTLQASIAQPGLYDLNAFSLAIDIGPDGQDTWKTRASFKIDGQNSGVQAAVLQVDDSTWQTEVWEVVHDQQ